jgi:hypothetical protein
MAKAPLHISMGHRPMENDNTFSERQRRGSSNQQGSMMHDRIIV